MAYPVHDVKLGKFTQERDSSANDDTSIDVGEKDDMSSVAPFPGLKCTLSQVGDSKRQTVNLSSQEKVCKVMR